ncbi:heavy metal response regulator transcription factor [Paraburkholderia caballeronis]|uniref:Two component heavy metal response transcriptional regulator, winged helix family n=1 Tax=Paraburkholderia caballeronis TaxID=416943 RepID=A0A1H7KUA5_9BURK|nr:heavy metal response regulator transcription factor [Paraburkholderia caballeronis]PXW28138.1 winged helix family two component heavy metal response transcriptional regulator [Paraburkholderia caballeronis]PXX03504.1 winged helix family two component heavy metal response transcriptional regulator [Paraburkholderia caballeronis]RAK04248.1 winged helix family two component heavy metal response transcriptional regulator [Paraburkholderia caballeronis]SED87765.1 two component heavy metal respons
MRILVIEDETKTGDYLFDGLTEAGYVVDVANNGIDGLHMAQEMRYDLILLDVMMPQMDGWTVMTKLGARTSTPVLFLSARGTLEDRLKGLDLGADDYLVKPFSFAELLARIRIILRRGQPQKQEDEVLEVGDLRIDVPKRRVERGGARITLTNKEFNLLYFFAQNQGQVLSRALIASRVWDMNFDSDTNVVDVAVRRLRQKIDEPFAVRLIHTVHGVGYRCEHEA